MLPIIIRTMPEKMYAATGSDTPVTSTDMPPLSNRNDARGIKGIFEPITTNINPTIISNKPKFLPIKV